MFRASYDDQDFEAVTNIIITPAYHGILTARIEMWCDLVDVTATYDAVALAELYLSRFPGTVALDLIKDPQVLITCPSGASALLEVRLPDGTRIDYIAVESIYLSAEEKRTLVVFEVPDLPHPAIERELRALIAGSGS